MQSDNEDDRIAELFARLTAHLEDAAALAAEGQQAELPLDTLRSLARGIECHLQKVETGLGELLTRLGD